jgi:hypothetical protein
VGDHGEDFWTHGFKGGLVHGTEPYTPIIHTPLVIIDPDLEPGQDRGIASTIDIMPTCLDLLDISFKPSAPKSGMSLLRGRHHHAFSQNYTAAQADNAAWGIRKAFSVTDSAFTLMASSDGLELYNHRLDPTNHCNLLHFFTGAGDGKLSFTPLARSSNHFRAAFGAGTLAAAEIAKRFSELRTALSHHVEGKGAYLVAQGLDPTCALDPRVFLRKSNRGGIAISTG